MKAARLPLLIRRSVCPIALPAKPCVAALNGGSGSQKKGPPVEQTANTTGRSEEKRSQSLIWRRFKRALRMEDKVGKNK